MQTQALNEMRPIRRGPARAVCAGAVLCLLQLLPAWGQTPGDMQKVLERLDRLEQQNRELTAEIHALRDQLAAVHPPPPSEQGAPTAPGESPEESARAAQAAQPSERASIEERLQVQENRTAELAATKVEGSQRFPIRLTGMLLFNSFLNSAGNGGSQYPIIAVPGDSDAGGASVRQTILGLDFDGPRILGGKVSGSVRMDFFGGIGPPLGQEVRLRTATVGIDGENRSFLFGVDKPLISPREPESIAQVGVSPLSSAGNLWLWIPQVRAEQDFHFSEKSGLRAQLGVVETNEMAGSPASPYEPGLKPSYYIEPARPGIEGRVELFSGDENRRIEVASGVHHSVSHVLGTSVASDVLSFDWLARPSSTFEFTGTFYKGHNVTPLGTGFIRQGFIALGPGRVQGVPNIGGWGQFTFRPISRLWFNLFTGQHNDRRSVLPDGAIGKNLVYGANLFYRLAPNVLASFEASQIRTVYIGSSPVLNNHYDLALAYLF